MNKDNEKVTYLASEVIRETGLSNKQLIRARKRALVHPRTRNGQLLEYSEHDIEMLKIVKDQLDKGVKWSDISTLKIRSQMNELERTHNH